MSQEQEQVHNTLYCAASNYLAAGFSVLPADRAEKRPDVGAWKKYQCNRPNERTLSAWFRIPREAVCIVCGEVSGNLEIIDFDAGGELFEPWCERIPADLQAKLVVERTPSGGYHVVYRHQGALYNNMKLARRAEVVSEDEVYPNEEGRPMARVRGKEFQVRRDGGDGEPHVVYILIETRGEGGQFVCTPTPGYEVIQGDLTEPPVLTGEERDTLLRAAEAFNEYTPPVINGPSQTCDAGAAPLDGRPGDYYNRLGDVRALLQQHGWVCVRGGENEYWRRPGKTQGSSATLKNRVFYVFSPNAAPLDADKGYSPFAVYTLLTCNGDFTEAASRLYDEGFSDDGMSGNVNITGILRMCSGPAADEPGDDWVEVEDPGILPVELLRVPGFAGEVMDYCLETAPYPNPILAFSGAMTLQAFLAGRKVRDPGDNRTNLYLLGLAHSAGGKDWPRKINTRILHEIGMADCLGDRFASGEGIQDAMYLTPNMLFQTDEIDGMLQQINKSPEARYENIMGTLLSMYSSANSVFPMRRKAGSETGGFIDQPNLTIFGTAIPNHYYHALSERMLTNGFFARMVVLESGPRLEGQEPTICRLPERVVATARWWAEFRPGTGDLADWHPVPIVVEQDGAARDLLVAIREEADAEYARAEGRNDPVSTTVWGRVSEEVRKLALLYAISECYESPRISREAVEWAARFVMHLTRRKLFMARAYVADNPFHAQLLQFLEKLRSAGGELAHSALLKRMKTDARRFRSVVNTLLERGDIETRTQSSAGRPGCYYRLVENQKRG